MNSGNNTTAFPPDLDLGPMPPRHKMVGDGLISPDIFRQIVDDPLPVNDLGTNKPDDHNSPDA